MLGKVGLVLVWPFGYLCVEHLTMSSIFSPLSYFALFRSLPEGPERPFRETLLCNSFSSPLGDQLRHKTGIVNVY